MSGMLWELIADAKLGVRKCWQNADEDSRRNRRSSKLSTPDAFYAILPTIFMSVQHCSAL